MIREAEHLRARLSWAQSLIYQLESASAVQDFDVGKSLYNKIRGVYKELVDFRDKNGIDGLKLVVCEDKGLTELINCLAIDFIRPLPEDTEFDYKKKVFSKKLNEAIMIVRQNIVYRGKYQHNVDGLVTYHEQEGVLINSAKCTDEELKGIHLIKKIFDGELLSAKGIENPDLPSSVITDVFGGFENKGPIRKKPELEVIRLEFCDTRG